MKRFFIGLFIVLTGAFVFAEGIVSDIKISGLKKTKPEYILGLLEKFNGLKESELNFSEVETALRAPELFSEIDIKLLNEDGSEVLEKASSEKIILSVQVKEKITFIPLPFVAYSSNGFMGGFMLMNMNIGGKKNMLIIGGVFSKSMQMGMVTFAHPAKDIKHPGFNIFSSFSHKEFTLKDFSGDEIFECEHLAFHAMGNLNFKFTEVLIGSAGFQYMMEHSLEDDKDGVQQWLCKSSLGIGKTKWNGWYMLDRGAIIKGACGYSTDNEFIYEAQFLSHYEIPLFERNRLGLKLNGAVEANKNILLKQGRGEIGSTIMADGFKSEKLFGTCLSFEGALAKTPLGILTLYGLYEYNIAEDYDDSFICCHGPGAGIRFYFKQLAFPAFSGGVTYNVSENLWQYSIAVGISM